MRPFTILRTHLEVTVRTDQTGAIETFYGAYGSTVVTDTASSIGVTAVPDPSGVTGDPEADWFLWTPLSFAFFIDINGTDGVAVDGDIMKHYIVDSKAMRKVGPDDDVVSVVSNDSAVGCEMNTMGRRLIQLW